MEGATYNLLACCLYAFISVAITFFNVRVLFLWNTRPQPAAEKRCSPRIISHGQM